MAFSALTFVQINFRWATNYIKTCTKRMVKRNKKSAILEFLFFFVIPIYKALDIIDVFSESVGRTRPWVILAQTKEGIKPYVVKLFTTQQISAQNSVTAELLGNLLAPEFELSTPKSAFIEFPETIKKNLGKDLIQQLDNADERLKFATEVVEGFNRFDAGIVKKEIAKRIEIDTLFAFDCLIKNQDRGQVNPNLLIKPETAYLIDHELSFGITQKNIDNLKANIIEPSFFNRHIFYRYLHKSTNSSKREYFETFHEYLRLLNTNKLNHVFSQLKSLGYETNEEIIVNYINEVKHYSVRFVNLLKLYIQ